MSESLCLKLPQTFPPTFLQAEQEQPYWLLYSHSTRLQAICPVATADVLGTLHGVFNAAGHPYTAQLVTPIYCGSTLVDLSEDADYEAPDLDEAGEIDDWRDHPSLTPAERNPSLSR